MQAAYTDPAECTEHQQRSRRSEQTAHQRTYSEGFPQFGAQLPRLQPLELSRGLLCRNGLAPALRRALQQQALGGAL